MTTEQATRVVPAGWYEDPANAANVRWWNGIAWTDHVDAKPASATTSETVEDRIAEARALEREYGISTAENEIITRAASSGAPSGHPTTGTIAIINAAPVRSARTSTFASWLLGATPVIALVLALIAGYVFFYVTPTPFVAAVVAVVYLLGFLWAIGDSRALVARGHDAPRPTWALVLPVIGPLLYLIVRRRTVPGSTALVAFVALLVVTLGLPAAAVATGSATVVTKALEVQQAIRADLIDSGAATSVTCPPILESVEVGKVFTCDAVLPSGNTVHVWVSIDTEDGHFSWALANR